MDGNETPDLQDPDLYDHWVRDTVRFCDQDAAGHINNTAIAQYVESGRIAFVRTQIPPPRDGERFIAAHLSIDFLAEAQYPGDVHIGSRLLRIGNKSLTGASGVYKDEICIATATWVVVFLRGQETAELTPEIRRGLEAL